MRRFLRRRYRRLRKLYRVNWFRRRATVRSILGRVRRQRVVHMLHIPKTGGTAVQTAIRRGPRPPGVRILMHPHQVRLRDIPARDEVFFFVRDPVTRYVSSFDDRLREGRPGYYRPWGKGERPAFKRFPSAEALALGLGASDEDTRRAARKAMRSIGHVKHPLKRWLERPELVRARATSIVFVGAQETLARDFARLKTLIGLDEACALPKTDRETNRAPTEQAALSPAAVENLRAWFREDYELLAVLREVVPGTSDAVGAAPPVEDPQGSLTDAPPGPTMPSGTAAGRS